MKTCSTEGCERKYHGKGLCHFHYVVLKRQTAPKCIEDDCEKPSRAKGMCTTHYDRYLRGSEMEIEDYQDFWEFVKKEVGIA
jgi:hypothetical protein